MTEHDPDVRRGAAVDLRNNRWIETGSLSEDALDRVLDSGRSDGFDWASLAVLVVVIVGLVIFFNMMGPPQ